MMNDELVMSYELPLKGTFKCITFIIPHSSFIIQCCPTNPTGK